MSEPTNPPGGPRRTGRAVPMPPAEISPEEFGRMTSIVDKGERALRQRKAEGWHRKRGPTIPAVAHHGGINGDADPYHPEVRRHLVVIEKLLRKVEQTTYQRMSTVFDDWVGLTNIMLDSLPGHLREAVETGRISDWPDDTPPERIVDFDRIKARYGEKASDAFGRFAEAAGAFLDATHDVWFDWMGQLYMSLELGGRGVGDYFTPWPLAYLMADMEDIPALLQTRLMEALTDPENALAAAVGMTGMLFQPGPAGESPVMGDEEVNGYFHRWVLPAAMPFFEPITVMDPACGSGVMLLASAATVPLWARRYGFVQFFGQDIMHIAVQMAKAQTRAYGLNGFEVQMITAIGDVGWEKYRAKLQASAEYHAAMAAEEVLAAAPHGPGPALTVIPRQVTGHVAHPTLRRRAAEQAAPTFSLKRPTPEEAARLLASRPRPTTSRGVRP